MTRRRVSAVLALTFAVFGAFADDADILDLEARVSEAARQGDYGGASRLLQESRRQWPEEPRIPRMLGDLYSERELHSLALDEYLAAESLSPGDPETMQRVADEYGFLNREEDSIRYLRRILEKTPNDTRALEDLGWMLFKTHRLREGVALLEDAEARLGKDVGFSMTLGTLRSELFDYQESKRRYLEAIKESQAAGYARFTSVAYYNLSLLESRFRFWDSALEAANQSILAEARSSGYLARGELRLRRMELRAAEEDFKNAYSLDTTPLARISLAQAAVLAGRQEEALAWVRDVAKLEAHPWMASFGTDPMSFSMDVHELFWEIFRGLAEREKARPKRGPIDVIGSMFKRTLDRVRAAYHRRLFRKAARAVSLAYRKEGADLPAAVHGAVAFGDYPWLSEKYLEESRVLETAAVPGAEAVYALKEAELREKPDALRKALEKLDPVWERDVTADGLGELASILSGAGRVREARVFLERLWMLNPGALPSLGFSVPALVSLEAAPETSRAAVGSLRRRLRRLGMGLEGDGDEAYAFGLELQLGPTSAEYRLIQRASGIILKKGTLRFSDDKVDAADLAAVLFDRLNEANP